MMSPGKRDFLHLLQLDASKERTRPPVSWNKGVRLLHVIENVLCTDVTEHNDARSRPTGERGFVAALTTGRLWL